MPIVGWRLSQKDQGCHWVLVRIAACGDACAAQGAIEDDISRINENPHAPFQYAVVIDQTIRRGVVIAAVRSKRKDFSLKLQELILSVFKVMLDSKYEQRGEESRNILCLQILGGKGRCYFVNPLTLTADDTLEFPPKLDYKEVVTRMPQLASSILARMLATIGRVKHCNAGVLCGRSAAFGPSSIGWDPTEARGAQASKNDSVLDVARIVEVLPIRANSDGTLTVHVQVSGWRVKFAGLADLRCDDDTASRHAMELARSAGTKPKASARIDPESSFLAARRSHAALASDDAAETQPIVDSYTWPSLIPASVVAFGVMPGTVDIVEYVGSSSRKLYTDILGDFASIDRTIPVDRLVLSAAPLRRGTAATADSTITDLDTYFRALPFAGKIDRIQMQGGDDKNSVGDDKNSAPAPAEGKNAAKSVVLVPAPVEYCKLPATSAPTDTCPLPMHEVLTYRNAWPAPVPDVSFSASEMQALSPALWLRLGLPVYTESSESDAESGAGAGGSGRRKGAGNTSSIGGAACASFNAIQASASVLFHSLYRRCGSASALEPDDPIAGKTDAELERLQEESQKRRRIHEREKFADRFKSAKSTFVRSGTYAVAKADAEQHAKDKGIHIPVQGEASSAAVAGNTAGDVAPDDPRWDLVMRRPGQKHKPRVCVPERVKGRSRQQDKPSPAAAAQGAAPLASKRRKVEVKPYAVHVHVLAPTSGKPQIKPIHLLGRKAPSPPSAVLAVADHNQEPRGASRARSRVAVPHPEGISNGRGGDVRFVPREGSDLELSDSDSDGDSDDSLVLSDDDD